MTGQKPTPNQPPANPIELVCQEVVELVTEYLSAALPPVDRVRFEKHLLTCPPCTAYLAQIQVTRGLAAELGPTGPSPAPGDREVERELAALFRRWHGKSGKAGT